MDKVGSVSKACQAWSDLTGWASEDLPRLHGHFQNSGHNGAEWQGVVFYKGADGRRSLLGRLDSRN